MKTRKETRKWPEVQENASNQVAIGVPSHWLRRWQYFLDNYRIWRYLMPGTSLFPWNRLLAMLVKHWEIGLPHSWAIALPQSKWDCHSLKRRANGWNISFVTLYSGQFTLSTQLIKPNYPVVLSHWHSTTVSSETYPLHPTSPLGGKLHYGGVPPIWLSLPPSLPPNTALPPEGSISSAERDTYKTKLPSL